MRSRGPHLGDGAEWRISRTPVDGDWNAFVSSSGGHHTQSSLWAQVKAAHGWTVTRVVASRKGEILGGAQILSRSLFGFPFQVGYVSNGPVVSRRAHGLIQGLLEAVETIARRHRIWLLRIQPPQGKDSFTQPMEAMGYHRSRVSISPVSTLVLDLDHTEEELLAGMSSSTRRNIRYASRRGVAIQSGGPEDLPQFHRLLVETAQRKNFKPYGLDYFHTLWQVLGPGGHVQLLFARRDDSPVAAILLLAFGDTVHAKFSGASEAGRSLKAPNLLRWEAIRWAKRNGFRRFDQEGIDRDVAELMLRGDPLPPVDTPSLGVTFYKLGFGGQPKVLPLPYEKGFGPLGPLVGTRAFSAVTDWRPLVNWVRRSH